MNKESKKQSLSVSIALSLLVVIVSACTSLQTTEQEQEGPLGSQLDSGEKETPGDRVSVPRKASGDKFMSDKDGYDEEEEATETVRIYKGTGKFVKQVPSRDGVKTPEKGDVTLNFENTDIREIVKVILGDLLQVNYVVDPGVRGGVTMQTGRPLKREDLLPTLETLLRMNGAAMVETAGTYRIAPAAKVLQGAVTPQLAGTSAPLPSGYNLLVVPLKYISAGEMGKILQPLAAEGSIIRIDLRRNLLVLAGTGRELNNMLDTVQTFDVDWLEGLSVGFFELQYAEIADVQRDLEAILVSKGDEGLGSVIKVLPIESANGLLVVTQRPEYLDKISTWIERMDDMGATTGAEVRLFVYRVKNGDAEQMADMLNSLYSSKEKESPTPPGSVAPGLTPKEIETPAGKQEQAEKSQPKPKTLTQNPNPGAGAAALDSEVSIVADINNNNLLIMATARDYDRMLDVLKELDIVPLQVHIEATIIEITLTDTLKYGVQWFFNNQHGDYTGVTSFSNRVATNDIARDFGFNWTLAGPGGKIRAALSAVANDTDVNVLSAPSIMVLDNQTAKIQVGDSVPTVTTQQQGTQEGSNVINSVQYRDTGVILNVKPRVNPGGLVTMEIEQEVSLVKDTDLIANSPTISTRNINSTVAVQSGQAVVLGGLIQNDENKIKGGIPGLYKLPVVGPLFGDTTNTTERKELVVILTPSVIANSRDAQKITEDFRSQMSGLKGSF